MSEVQQDELPGLKPTPASDSHSELRSNRSGNADKLSRFFESVSGSLGFSGLTAQSPAASQGVSGVLVSFWPRLWIRSVQDSQLSQRPD